MSKRTSISQQFEHENHVRWNKVHPVTPLVQSAKVIMAIFLLMTWHGYGMIGTSAAEFRDFRFSSVVALYVSLVGVLLLAIIGGFSYISWRKIRYTIGEDSVYYHHGIIFRKQRHARLNRIQAVDIVRPLLARFFGLAAVDIQTAGSAQSNVQIQFLRETDAKRVRNEILARAAGVKAQQVVDPASADLEVVDPAGVPVTPSEKPTAQLAATPVQLEFTEAPEQVVIEVPVTRLLSSLALSISIISAVIALLIGIVLTVTFQEWGLLPMVLPYGLIIGALLWTRFAGEFGFNLAISPDGLRTRHGLTETRAQTIPPRRIQAVRISQPVLWRYCDWWRVEVNVAGYFEAGATETSTATVKNIVLPVGDRIELERVLWLILPDLGVTDSAATITALLTGSGPAHGFLTPPRKACLLDWFTWRRHGLRVTETALLMRSGFFIRKAVVVPHERTQALEISQGPLERLLRIANLHAHSVAGPAVPKAHHLPQELALQILFEQTDRARLARRQEGPEEWMRRTSSLKS